MKNNLNHLVFPYKKSSLKTFIVVFISILFSIVTIAQEHSRFKKLAPKQSGKSLFITHTVQDRHGYIWMLHSLGIAKYDGNSYFFLELDEVLKNINSEDRIIEMKKDYKDNIWILTNTGRIAVYNSSGNFSELIFSKNNAIKGIYPNNNAILLTTKSNEIYVYSYSDNTLNRNRTITNIIPSTSEFSSIVQDRNKDLFIGTNKGKIFKYSLRTKKTTEIVGTFSNSIEVIRLIIDFKNKLWIGTETFGVFVYDIRTEKFIQDKLFKVPFYNIKSEMIISLFCDSSGYIWAGTDGSGLFRIDPNNGFIQLLTHHKNNPFSLSTNTILNINEDSHKNIWAMSNYGEVNILSANNNDIIYHEGSDDNTPTRILSIFKSNNETLWLGTDGHGITKIKTSKKRNDLNKSIFNPKRKRVLCSNYRRRRSY